MEGDRHRPWRPLSSSRLLWGFAGDRHTVRFIQAEEATGDATGERPSPSRKDMVDGDSSIMSRRRAQTTESPPTELSPNDV